MGGRGSKSGISTGERIVIDNDGGQIELETPLKYGNDEKRLSGKARDILEEFENKRWQNKIEFMEIINDSGDILGNYKGGKGSVSYPIDVIKNAFATSHNHPRGGGRLGGTFSVADIRGFVEYESIMRATAKEGTYSISKGKNFNGSGLTDYYRKAESDAKAKMTAKIKQAGQSFVDGRINYKEYSRQYDAAANSAMVELHNKLLAGQKKYGYNYTLERRKKK